MPQWLGGVGYFSHTLLAYSPPWRSGARGARKASSVGLALSHLLTLSRFGRRDDVVEEWRRGVDEMLKRTSKNELLCDDASSRPFHFRYRPVSLTCGINVGAHRTQIL
ncbi:hypothetical protein BD410DRAFT_797259 [Rickenella mellea]|uniref:Uncharacterized protein n=1 Tax=Rickenella mellea TaxID=50990 RepID=A0A4Y7PGI6_9AGAM|nr:hypothetical protein BD410DRAFT_797259 [Rickenella mellea]